MASLRSAYVASTRILVSQAADGGDQLGVTRVGFQLAPQPLDVDVERLCVADIIVSPNPINQCLAWQHAAGVDE